MSFADQAAKSSANTRFFAVTEGREAIKTADLIAKYPEGVTVTGFTTMPNKKGETISAFTFKEDPAAFFFGGMVLTELAKKWVSEYDENFVTASAALAAEGGVKLKLIRKKSKTGTEYTDYEVVGSETPEQELPFN